MEFAILGVLLVGNGFLLWKIRTDDAFLREYVRTSPKAFLWRKVFGEEQAAAIIRNVFVPGVMVLWIVILAVIGVEAWSR